MILDKFRNASVFESDLVGFTAFSSKKSAAEVVSKLHELYCALDAQCVSAGLEKIDTIGDAYICATFQPNPAPLLSFAMKVITLRFDEIGIRVGVATGKIIGTVLGEV